MKTRLLLPLAILIATGFSRPAVQATEPALDLEKSFLSPPDSAKPWVYWYFNHCNLTREGITADLEDMKHVGLGGALILDAAEGALMGQVMLSPEWWKLVEFYLQEAERLGLKLNFHNSPSWSGSGGPWVKPEEAMQIVVMSETNFAGPARIDALLPKPPVVAVDLPRWGAKSESLRHYRDTMVLAFPTPAAEATPYRELIQSVTVNESARLDDFAILDDQLPETAVTVPP